MKTIIGFLPTKFLFVGMALAFSVLLLEPMGRLQAQGVWAVNLDCVPGLKTTVLPDSYAGGEFWIPAKCICADTVEMVKKKASYYLTTTPDDVARTLVNTGHTTEPFSLKPGDKWQKQIYCYTTDALDKLRDGG